MELKLDINMNQSTFWHLLILFIMLIITILVYKDEYGFFVVNTYENCTCPKDYPEFWYYTAIYNDVEPEIEEKDEFITNKSFLLCPEGLVPKQVTCDCYEEFGCMAYCYECVNKSEVDERFFDRWSSFI